VAIGQVARRGPAATLARMGRELRFKLLILACTLLACAGAWASREPLRAAGGRWHDRLFPPPPPPPEPPRTEPAEIRSRVLDEAAVSELLPHLAGATWVRYDPLAIVRVVPDLELDIPWPEHAGGKMTLRTNAQGFREDEDTPAVAAGPRVLVLGDSHTFGLVENDESFPNLIEQKLRSERGGAPCEVINAGASGTGPFETRALLGLLLAELQPDLVVFVLYAGNDYLNTQAFADFEARRPRTPLPRDAQLRFKAARERERERMAQHMSQVHTFKYRTGDCEVALAATLECLREMAMYCSERGARFLVAVLPPKEDVDLGDLGHMRAVRDELELCDEDFALVRRLTEHCLLGLEAAHIPALDLTPQLTGKPVPLYWTRDHHLDVAGHRAVALALLDPVRSLLPADGN
jgi:hypothetical protein